MRRLTILTVRATLVLALVAAIVDVRLPARTSARTRLHLIDRSDSVRRGPPDAPRPEDADRIRAYDQQQKEPGDTVLWASFGREIAFESTAVDGSETDLAGALEASLARNPTEIVLHTDGRADPGRALLLCRARGVPIHVFPLGAAAVRDARIAAVAVRDASIDVTVVSSFDAVHPVRLNDLARETRLVAGVPTIVSFPGRPLGRFKVSLDAQDECPENDAAEGVVQVPSGRRKLLAISNGFPDSIAGFDVRRSPVFVDPQGMDAVVLDNVALSPEQQGRLAAWVQGGRGLLLLGGKQSYALGGWKGTPIEEVSPLRANPDQMVAVVFVIDCSGSMREKLDPVIATVKAAWTIFETGDFVAAYSFPEGRWAHKPGDLKWPEAAGGTNIAGALEEARRRLVQEESTLKKIFLLTDGETSPKETPKERRDVGDRLKENRIDLTVVTVGKPIEIGEQIPLEDWKGLRAKFDQLLPSTREVFKDKPGTLALHDHPATTGVPSHPLEWMNLTIAKLDAQVVGTVGKAHAVAFRQAGRGRVGAFAFDRPHPKLLAQAIDHVAGPSSGGLLLSIDPPVVRARGADPSPLHPTYTVMPSGPTGPIEFRQVLSDVWEAALPRTQAGTLWIECGTSHAALTIPCAPEYEALGIDRKALERIASETGGRILGSPSGLPALPRPSAPAPRSGRPLFLVAALVLVFLEMALTTFWKA